MNDIVSGEASESEDESRGFSSTKKIVLAAEVLGEASESDEDVYDKSLESVCDGKNNTVSMYNNNLLQRKLIDNNLNIWRSINILVRSLVTPGSKQLLSIDQLLIKSQLSIQSVLITLNQTQNNMKQLNGKCEAAFTTNFIPNISIANN